MSILSLVLPEFLGGLLHDRVYGLDFDFRLTPQLKRHCPLPSFILSVVGPLIFFQLACHYVNLWWNVVARLRVKLISYLSDIQLFKPFDQ